MLENQHQVLTTRDPLRPFEDKVIEKVCPSCSSVFITKKECESCGLQFQVNLVGSPLDYRSFFTLKEDFEDNLSFIEKRSPLEFRVNSKKHQKYLRTLNRRFDILCNYLFEGLDGDKEERKFFLYETKELINELIILGGKSEWPWKRIERYEEHPFYPLLCEEISRSAKEWDAIPSLYKRFFNHQLMGVFKISFILQVLTVCLTTVFFAYCFYAFLFSNSVKYLPF